jgi:enoyl-CoA hydratase/carnithine racemase
LPIARRTVLKAGAGFVSTWIGPPTLAQSADGESVGAPQSAEKTMTMAETPAGVTSKVTVERRGQIVLIGINRPSIHNRVDPETYLGLAKAYYQYEHDASLRAAVLFGHGDNFSRGIDVDAFQAVAASGRPLPSDPEIIDPLARTKGLSKPLVVAVHGDTWNMGHELHLVADIRIAAADTRFGQDENTHGRFPGGGATVRFVREAGWANAMRYMLTGDHWSAAEALRMGVVQTIAPTAEAALEAGVETATKIAACGPLGIKATLASAHLAIDASETEALSKLEAQYRALYGSEDFKEGRKAEAEGRPPVYEGR